ncbi:MAG: histidine kinase, partial [Fulvivirga sp.]|nr:histidine kinase [Fulvivirga sp.]
MQIIKKGEWALHLLLVLSALFLLNYSDYDLTLGVFRSGNQTLLWPSIIGTGFNLILFYGISLFLIPEILRKRSNKEFILYLTLFFCGVTGLEIATDGFFASIHFGEVTSPMWTEIVLLDFLIHVITLLAAFAYRFAKDWFINEKLRNEMHALKLRTELEMLKSQINPHFLFNALNNLFSMSLQHGDEKTAEGISKLSEMMRYVFDHSNKEKLPLSTEIKYIEDYVYMQALRFKDNIDITFKYPALNGSPMVAPMLFIPFVENAFKYGVSSNDQSKIQMEISWKDKQVIFYIKNEKVAHKESIQSTN